MKGCPTPRHIPEMKRRAKAFAQKHGAGSWCTDLEELAEADDVDAVYIASPNSLHCGQAIQMMRHGKHVLCEKAAASNSRELEGMLAAARENRVVFLEAMRRHLTRVW